MPSAQGSGPNLDQGPLRHLPRASHRPGEFLPAHEIECNCFPAARGIVPAQGSDPGIL